VAFPEVAFTEVAFTNNITPNTSAKLRSKRAVLDFRRKGAVATLAV
jgi:hypothetical protein